MIVFIGGMQRSGSTFCFNVVRDILQQSGPVHCEATDDLVVAQAAARDADHLVIKAHSASPALMNEVLAGRIKSIISIRAMEDAIASCIDIWGISLSHAIANLRIWHDMYRVMGASSLIIPFETIDGHPEDAVSGIASFLSQAADLTAIAARYAKAAVEASTKDMRPDQTGVRNVGFSYYDERTFFHRRHVISSARRDATKILSPSDLKRIKMEFGEFSADAR